MRQFVLGTCLLTASALIGHGQTFEVASIKVSRPGQQGQGNGRANIEPTPGRITMRNVDLMTAMMWAYKLPPVRMTITDSTALGQDRYDIDAKASGPAKVDEMRTMMQNLLVERFKMTLRRETKELPAYALVEAKGGHKLKESEAEDGPGVTTMTAKMGLSARKATLDQLAMYLASPLRSPVVDMTGLKGKYDFEFDISAYVPMDGDRQPGDPSPDPVYVLQSVLPKQLGLRLESRKMPIEMLIIDHIQKPVEN